MSAYLIDNINVKKKEYRNYSGSGHGYDFVITRMKLSLQNKLQQSSFRF